MKTVFKKRRLAAIAAVLPVASTLAQQQHVRRDPVGDATPPEIVHAAGQPGQTRPFSGYVDPRLESSNGIDIDLGLNKFTIVFSEPVFSVNGGGPVDVASFEVRQSGAGTPPNVMAVDSSDNPVIEVTLDRVITPQEWTTIQAVVQDAAGNLIRNEGDLGPGVNEPDRVDVAFLPGDIDQGGQFRPLDILRFQQNRVGTYDPPLGVDLDYFDISRDGELNLLDYLRLRQVAHGNLPATQIWLDVKINHPRP